jgi:hypothetical protein
MLTHYYANGSHHQFLCILRNFFLYFIAFGSNVLDVIRFQTNAQNVQLTLVSQLMMALDLVY